MDLIKSQNALEPTKAPKVDATPSLLIAEFYSKTRKPKVFFMKALHALSAFQKHQN